MRSVESAECRKCGVWKMRCVENEECGKCGVLKKKSIFHFSFISLMSVKNEARVIWKVALIL